MKELVRGEWRDLTVRRRLKEHGPGMGSIKCDGS